jgi:D-glycero-D-manno-heptose 1,7-bisphosphate phosphatase
VILGRDGILNDYPRRPRQVARGMEPDPGRAGGRGAAQPAGWHTVVATNQSGIGRGMIDMASVNAVHLPTCNKRLMAGGRAHRRGVLLPAHARRRLRLPQAPARPDEDIGKRFDVAIHEVHLVGASLRDLQTARAAGCQPHLLRGDRLAAAPPGTLEQMLQQVPGARVHQDLAAFAEWLVQHERELARQAGEPLERDSGAVPLHR